MKSTHGVWTKEQTAIVNNKILSLKVFRARDLESNSEFIYKHHVLSYLHYLQEIGVVRVSHQKLENIRKRTKAKVNYYVLIEEK